MDVLFTDLVVHKLPVERARSIVNNDHFVYYKKGLPPFRLVYSSTAAWPGCNQTIFVQIDRLNDIQPIKGQHTDRTNRAKSSLPRRPRPMTKIQTRMESGKSLGQVKKFH